MPYLTNIKSRPEKNSEKRYLIALIINLLILFLSRHYWLVSSGNHYYQFEVCVFFIILICGYFISFKISDYLAEFKTDKKYSRIDILFLTVFFFFLFIPMINIDKSEISNEENRKLELFKPLFIIKEKKSFNYNFGKDFEKWFNDRFFLRKYIVNINTIIKVNLNKYSVLNNGVFLNKKNNYFLVTGFHKKAIRNISKDKLKLYKKSFKGFFSYCKETNKECYVIIIPEKGVVYEDRIYDGIERNIRQKEEISGKILKSYKNKRIIYPIKSILKNKDKVQLYYKNDHHMTDEGNLLAYNEFLKRYNKVTNSDYRLLRKDDFEVEINNKRGIPQVQNDDILYTVGSSYQAFNYNNEKLLDEEYAHYLPKKGNSYINKNVAVIGDSYAPQLKPFFINTFKFVQFYVISILRPKEREQYFYKNLKEFENSDVIVLLVSTVNIDYILEVLKKEN